MDWPTAFTIVVAMIVYGVLYHLNNKRESQEPKIEPRPPGFVISVACDFHPVPYGRISEDGPFNGTRFREEFLVPALAQHEKVVVDFSGMCSVSASWLNEVFEHGDVAAHSDRLSLYSDEPLMWGYTMTGYKFMERWNKGIDRKCECGATWRAPPKPLSACPRCNK